MMYLRLVVFLLLIINIHSKDSFCYTNRYSCDFNQFSFEQFNENFEIDNFHPLLGCTLDIYINYKTRRLHLTWTKSVDNFQDDRVSILRNNHIMIKVSFKLSLIEFSR